MSSDDRETGHVEWKAVCREDDCEGIDWGPYSHIRYARSDKHAHEKQHEQRGETADVEVVKQPVDTDTQTMDHPLDDPRYGASNHPISDPRFGPDADEADSQTAEEPDRDALLEQAEVVTGAVEASMYYPVAHGEAERLQSMIEERCSIEERSTGEEEKLSRWEAKLPLLLTLCFVILGVLYSPIYVTEILIGVGVGITVGWSLHLHDKVGE